ncbi:nucleoside hydrolase [Gymnodinialimonas ceratoperidinii]|uniref:Nucleoside hydrolase n=1 Tax=Gymnodinialimonas ceratoperidinii TaxID=2856823 RepID=A0A8F6TZI0_9RHOB|nr:nucleoside hydrolase [Gymnodinialimonas ceratoperidinii]QXT40592.1 nucleoside hydrolase [Gymnodinialimonas ceratoperidinii]
MQRRLILDTDGGVDDAQALLMLIAAGRTPDVILTVFGNVGLEQATRNILTVLSAAGQGDVPVHLGADRPLIQPYVDATEIHGADGLGGAPRPAEIPEPVSRDGVGLLIEELRQAARAGDKVDLLMIGPLTNLALALRVAPDCVEGIGQLTIMGGSIHGRGNVTPAAEFNIYSDPEAAAIVFAAEIETLLVPWEVCTDHRISGETVDQMLADAPETATKPFSAALVKHARAVSQGYTGKDYFRFVDPLAAACVIDPSLATKTLSASVDVALAPGITRGMTVVDPSGRLGTPKITLLEEADTDRVAAIYEASISCKAPEGAA